jgi:hypothetical protein
MVSLTLWVHSLYSLFIPEQNYCTLYTAFSTAVYAWRNCFSKILCFYQVPLDLLLLTTMSRRFTVHSFSKLRSRIYVWYAWGVILLTLAVFQHFSAFHSVKSCAMCTEGRQFENCF